MGSEEISFRRNRVPVSSLNVEDVHRRSLIVAVHGYSVQMRCCGKK